MYKETLHQGSGNTRPSTSNCVHMQPMQHMILHIILSSVPIVLLESSHKGVICLATQLRCHERERERERTSDIFISILIKKEHGKVSHMQTLS